MAAMTAMSSAVAPKAGNRVAPFTGLARVALPCTAAPSFAQVTVSNKSHSKASAFMVWEPQNNKFFETLSYLPPLSSDAIARQVDYITRNGWTPALEFSDAQHAYISSENCIRFTNGASVNYYDNRYWTMYKLPMFGCSDSGQVLREVENASRDFPEAYIRLIAFDAKRQVQVTSMLVHRPNLRNPEFRNVEERSV